MLGIKQAALREQLRRQFGEKFNRRPECPCCHQDAPVGRKMIRWAELYGHRCPHGEPCPSFAEVPAEATRCKQCAKLARKSA